MTTDTLTPANRYFTDFQQRLEPDWVERQFAGLVERGAALAQSADVGAWVELVDEHNELCCHIDTHLTRASLAFSQDTTDEAASAELRRINHTIDPAYTEGTSAFLKLVAAAPVHDALADHYGAEYLRRIDAIVATNDPVNTPLQVELSDLVMKYTEIFATGTFEWRGETHPLSFWQKASSDPDREARHAAFASYSGFVQRHADELERIYDEAVRLRSTMARNIGFDSFVELRYLDMWRFGYDREDVGRLRAAIREHVVPLAEQAHRAKARALYGEGGPELLHPADLEVDAEREPAMRVGIDGQLAAAARVFRRLNGELADEFDTLVADGRIDLAARPGKATGAFCTELADQAVPFVFCNSVGTPDDVTTLMHELGHAFNGALSAHVKPLLVRIPTLEACEIHSMSLELLTHPHIDEFFGDDTELYRRQHLRQTLVTLPYMAAIDEFQHEVFRSDRPTPDARERGEIWGRLAETYLPGVDHAAAPWWREHRWLRQLHVFRAPFYYIDYAIARLCSWQLWLDSLEDPADALDRYLAVCRPGGVLALRELCEAGRIGVPFDDGVVAGVAARLAPHVA